VLWIAEAFVGLTPLLFDRVIRNFMQAAGRLALCQGETNALLHDCHLVTDGLDAEMCILAIVLSG
jgi:hypothetical protein